jgi:hypothetical protein
MLLEIPDELKHPRTDWLVEQGEEPADYNLLVDDT